MNAIEAYRTVSPEAEAEAKFSQIQRLIAVDIVLSDIFSLHNQLFYHEGKPTSQDVTETMQFTRDIVRRAIFWTWRDLANMGSPLASHAFGMMTLSRASQNGEIEAVMIGDQVQAKERTTKFLDRQIRKDYTNQQVKPHGWPG